MSMPCSSVLVVLLVAAFVHAENGIGVSHQQMRDLQMMEWQRKRLHDAFESRAYGLGGFSNLVCAAVIEVDADADRWMLRGIECLTKSKFDPYNSLEAKLASGDRIPCEVTDRPVAGFKSIALSWPAVASATGAARKWTVSGLDVRPGPNRYLLGFHERRRFELTEGIFWSPTWRLITNGTVLVWTKDSRTPAHVALDEVKTVIRATSSALTENPIMNQEELEKAKQLRGILNF